MCTNAAPLRYRSMRLAFSALLLALAVTQPPTPQPPAVVPVPKGAAPCTADLRFVTVRVRRRDGSAVADADVLVRDARTGRIVHRAREPLLAGGGEYVAVQDGDVRFRSGAATSLTVEAHWHGARRTARLRVRATDSTGCHVERVGPPPTLTFP